MDSSEGSLVDEPAITWAHGIEFCPCFQRDVEIQRSEVGSTALALRIHRGGADDCGTDGNKLR